MIVGQDCPGRGARPDDAGRVRRHSRSGGARMPRRLVMLQTDPSLFVRLLLQHQNDLLGYILPLVGCLDDAQDVLQETATALWQKFDQYDPSRPFLPWAKRFAHHEVLMYHRKQRRYTFLSEELIESLIDRQAEQEPYTQQLQNALQDCVKK